MILTTPPLENWKRQPGCHRITWLLARSESLQPHTERSSRPGPEPPSVEADVYVWHYALLVVHARKEEMMSKGIFLKAFQNACDLVDRL